MEDMIYIYVDAREWWCFLGMGCGLNCTTNIPRFEMQTYKFIKFHGNSLQPWLSVIVD